MSDVMCKVCGEPWDYCGAKDCGDMEKGEWEAFKRGYGCPCCKGELSDPSMGDSVFEPQSMDDVEFGDEDPTDWIMTVGKVGQWDKMVAKYSGPKVSEAKFVGLSDVLETLDLNVGDVSFDDVSYGDAAHTLVSPRYVFGVIERGDVSIGYRSEYRRIKDIVLDGKYLIDMEG